MNAESIKEKSPISTVDAVLDDSLVLLSYSNLRITYGTLAQRVDRVASIQHQNEFILATLPAVCLKTVTSL